MVSETRLEKEGGGLRRARRNRGDTDQYTGGWDLVGRQGARLSAWGVVDSGSERGEGEGWAPWRRAFLLGGGGSGVIGAVAARAGVGGRPRAVVMLRLTLGMPRAGAGGLASAGERLCRAGAGLVADVV